MLTLIITVYSVAAVAYWSGQLVKSLPRIIGFLLTVLALPVAIPVGMILSLPDYFRKDGKYRKHQWAVWFFAFSALFLIIVLLLPVPET